jgi:ATP-dependent Clp protease ATP-binding subunit ClpX
MYELPAMKGVSKVIIDDNVIDGDGKPLLIYSDQPKVASGQQ